MTATPISKVLKIGLVQDGKLIEESVLGERVGLSIGLDPENTFPIKEQGIPRRHHLVEYSPSGFRMNLLESMKGRVKIDDQLLDLNEAIRKGIAKKHAKGYELLLSPSSKGKVTVGGSTILFQLVPAPIGSGQVAMPEEIKAGFFKNVDFFFTMVLFISAIVHTALILYVNSIPSSVMDSMQVDTDRLIPIVQADEIAIPDVTEEQKVEEEKGGGGGGGGGGRKGPDTGVENKGILALITRSGAAGGAVADLLNERGLGGNLQDALNKVGGVRVGGAGDVGIGSGTRGSGTGVGGGTGAGIGDIGSIGHGGSAGTGNKDVTKIKAKMATTAGGVSGKIDAGQVRGYISSQLGGIRHCYEMQLNVNPSLKGNVRIQFTIGGSGDVSGCSVVGDTMGNTLVSDCVCGRVRRWRFPAPEEGTVTVSYSFVFTPAD